MKTATSLRLSERKRNLRKDRVARNETKILKLKLPYLSTLHQVKNHRRLRLKLILIVNRARVNLSQLSRAT